MSSTPTDLDPTGDAESQAATGLTAVDWIVAIALALFAALFVAIGAVVFQGADTSLIDQLIEEGLLVSDVFTAAELADVTFALAWWTGIGFIVTGLAVFVADGWYVLRRRREVRAGKRPDRIAGTYSFTPSALVGAIVSYVTGFIPGSPVIGGAVAGYLHSNDRSAAIKVGAVSGLFAALPAVFILTVVFGALVMASSTVDVAAGGILFAGVWVFAVVVTVTLMVGLSALGGFLGAALRGRDRPDRSAPEPTPE